MFYGITTRMIERITMTRTRNFVWHRLAPEDRELDDGYEYKPPYLNSGGMVLKSHGLRKLAIFTPLRKRMRDQKCVDQEDLLLFSPTRLNDLLLVAMDGSNDVWKLSSVLKQDVLESINSVKILRLVGSRSRDHQDPSISFSSFGNIAKTIQRLVVGGYNPACLVSGASNIEQSGISFERLKDLELDISSFSNELNITLKFTGEIYPCLVRIHLKTRPGLWSLSKENFITLHLPASCHILDVSTSLMLTAFMVKEQGILHVPEHTKGPYSLLRWGRQNRYTYFQFTEQVFSRNPRWEEVPEGHCPV